MPHSTQDGLLQSVSRSFFLSMRMLPGPMRAPVSLGYLLARASDTLADTEAAPVALRRDFLAAFRDGLRAGRTAELSGFHAEVVRQFAPHQDHAGEAELLRRLPECWEGLAALSEANRGAVLAVMDQITTGQSWDLERFGDASGEAPASVESADELEIYTHRVAGCVGEFWTRVGYANLGNRFAPAAAESELLQAGRSLGQGLQLVNILRDLGADLRAGRCYLPKAELLAAGWSDDSRTGAIEAVSAVWRARCRAALAPGWNYVSHLRRGRVRAATALPLILAEKTLAKLDAAGISALEHRVKVGRPTVWRAMARALWA
jgi:farnesyl-diphosphate farnesyltransferase